MRKPTPTLYIVIPCYNEEEVLPETTKQLKVKISQLIRSKKITKASKILFVDDGSSDQTRQLIRQFSKRSSRCAGVFLSRNYGHQNALLAGLIEAKNHADVVISMDADLQDDINVICQMLTEYRNGSEIVYGVRSTRKKDTWFKRITAEGFYKFMRLMGVDIIFNHADYRLTSRKVLNELEKYHEVNLFLRGIFPLIGFQSSTVYYERQERFAGKSKYPLMKMLNFAWNGISSFSVKPLRIIAVLGFLITVLSTGILLYSIIVNMLGQTVEGWTFIVCSIWLMGGMQTLFLGIIGEYIGKIYSETKSRPRYSIAEIINDKS